MRLDRDVLAAVRMHAEVSPALVRLNLLDDVTFIALVDRTGPASAGYWLSGSIDGWAHGSLTLVVNGAVVAGTVRAPGATYTIRSVGGGRHVVRRLDLAMQPSLRDDVVPPNDGPAAPSGPTRTQPIRPGDPVSPTTRRSSPAEDGSRLSTCWSSTRGRR